MYVITTLNKALWKNALGGGMTQGMAIYGDFMFALRDSGSCLVFDLKKRDKDGNPTSARSFDTTTTMPYEFEDIDYRGDRLYCQTFESRHFAPVETINLKDLGIVHAAK